MTDESRLSCLVCQGVFSEERRKEERDWCWVIEEVAPPLVTKEDEAKEALAVLALVEEERDPPPYYALFIKHLVATGRIQNICGVGHPHTGTPCH